MHHGYTRDLLARLLYSCGLLLVILLLTMHRSTIYKP
jgi:hypothetical protein